MDWRFSIGLSVFGALLLVAALASDVASPLILVCLIPLLYALHSSNYQVAALAGFFFGIIAYSFIPLAVLQWGWDVTGYAVLMIGAFFSAFALLVKLLANVPAAGSVMVALPLAYGVMQLIGERLIACPFCWRLPYPASGRPATTCFPSWEATALIR